MAGGEKAKSSGEYGEKIVSKILKMIGWGDANSGVTVPCVYKEKHIKEGKQTSEKHGIDYVFQYKSPLRDATKQDVLISVKCRERYPATEKRINSQFKDFLLDLAYAMECFSYCDLGKRKLSGTNNCVRSGLIFWIDRDRGDGKENESVVDRIGNFHLGQEFSSYETIALVDNRRAQFLFTVLNFVNSKYKKEIVNFFYISTGLNNASLERVYFGKIMPYEYINANVIPFAISEGEKRRLLLAVYDKFCKEYLQRLIGLAQDLTSNWTAEVTIAFPDYNIFEHAEVVKEVKSSFENKEFVSEIEVITFNPDFRDEV